MSKSCKYIISVSKIIGIILTCLGIGMIIGLIIQWWGYILAVLLFLGGLCLLLKQ